jgi:hypothetical protein
MTKVDKILRNKIFKLSKEREDLKQRSLFMPHDMMLAMDLERVEDEIELIIDDLEDVK